jgi:hypothetical protein
VSMLVFNLERLLEEACTLLRLINCYSFAALAV